MEKCIICNDIAEKNIDNNGDFWVCRYCFEDSQTLKNKIESIILNDFEFYDMEFIVIYKSTQKLPNFMKAGEVLFWLNYKGNFMYKKIENISFKIELSYEEVELLIEMDAIDVQNPTFYNSAFIKNDWWNMQKHPIFLEQLWGDIQ